MRRQVVITSTPAGKAMFQMCGVFAEFELSIMRERIAFRLAEAIQYRKLNRTAG